MKAIEFAVLNWIAWEVEIGQEGQILDVGKLAYFANRVELHLKESEALSVLKPLQLGNLILWDIESLKSVEAVDTSDLSQTVLFYVKFFNEESIQVLNGVDRVSIKWKHLETVVSLETLDLLNVIAIENKCLEVDVLVGSLDFVDQVARVVNVLEVGRGLKVEGLPDLIPGSI